MMSTWNGSNGIQWGCSHWGGGAATATATHLYLLCIISFCCFCHRKWVYNPFHDDTIAVAIAAPYLFTLNPFIATILLPLPSLQCERTLKWNKMCVFYLCLCLSHGFKNESKTDESYFVGTKCHIFPLWESFFITWSGSQKLSCSNNVFSTIEKYSICHQKCNIFTKKVTFVMVFHAWVEAMTQTET